MANEQYVVIPGTQQRVYEGSVVMLFRLPNLKWILHYGFYNYSGRRQKGWYFSSVPADTVMPVFPEDLVGLTVLDGSVDPMPPAPGPLPPGPGPGPRPPHPPGPPAPTPIPFTPQDKAQVDSAMITLDNITERDKMGSAGLQDGKIVRVNDIDGNGTVEYYSWNAKTSTWEEASLGYRYMTRTEILNSVGSDIVDIVWSNENGALVLTNHAGTEISPIELSGVAHDPIYVPEQLTLRIPIYGREDFTMEMPADKYLRKVRFEKIWEFEDGSKHPAIVVTVSDGSTDEEIAGDASTLLHVFEGKETATTKIFIEGETYHITADVKLSSIANNPLKVDNEGLWVDLSGVVGKKQIQTGFLLVSDGNGEFTYGGDGIELETTTAIKDLENPEKKVVTANLIADAINAAVSALEMSLEAKIRDIQQRITSLEGKLDYGEGESDVILVTSSSGLARSSYKIGGSDLDTASTDSVATEEAMTKALSWNVF